MVRLLYCETEKDDKIQKIKSRYWQQSREVDQLETKTTGTLSSTSNFKRMETRVKRCSCCLLYEVSGNKLPW